MLSLAAEGTGTDRQIDTTFPIIRSFYSRSLKELMKRAGRIACAL